MYHVVIVEDSKILRQGMVLTFDWKALGCKVIGEADNGADGLALIREKMPDIVITDIRMPGVDGLTMIEMLHQEENPAVCLVISAYDAFEYAQRAMQHGVQEFLVKPFETEELRLALERSIRRVEDRKKLRKIHRQEAIISGDYIPKEGDLRARYAEEAVAFIKAHYAENISVLDIAEALSMSESHLSRVFRESMGCTLGEYITKHRIGIACELLQDVRLRVSEVAAQVGYSDSGYFSVSFRRIIGMSPNTYRAQLTDSMTKRQDREDIEFPGEREID